jgi:CheY-like chemotaxis protein
MSGNDDGLSGLRVFLAEDYYAIAAALEMTLERFGCQIVAVASSAADARAIADDVDADCALLDIDLGDGSCYAAAQRCRERGIPVIFLSGYDLPADLPSDLEGAPLLLKPVHADGVRRTLMELDIRQP